jgi:hypothetical protein
MRQLRSRSARHGDNLRRLRRSDGNRGGYVSRVSTTRTGAKWRALGFAIICLGIVVGVYSNPLLGLGLAVVGVVALFVRRFN